MLELFNEIIMEAAPIAIPNSSKRADFEEFYLSTILKLWQELDLK